MDLFQVFILSVVEGVSEFLPISSTGHLVLTADFLGITQTDFVKSFQIYIQLGAILAVVVSYWRKILLSKSLWKLVLISFLPTVVFGFVFYKFIKEYLLGNVEITLWALLLGGFGMIIFEYFYSRRKDKLEKKEELMNAKQALVIGLIQSLSMIPGVSRAAATIFGGMSVGLTRSAAVEFSFILAIPTMLGATTLDLVQSDFVFSNQEWILIAVGFLCSFVTALVVIRWLVKFVEKNNFILFGVYRIILAGVYWFVLVR